MKINWKVRLKNKYFWLSMIPALLLLIRQILEIFGLAVDLSMLQEQLISVIGTVFSILALIGVVVDPTTKGISDSDQAMGYIEPKSSEDERDS